MGEQGMGFARRGRAAPNAAGERHALVGEKPGQQVAGVEGGGGGIVGQG